jgi:hypothetical protein
MADHGGEALVDRTLLAAADLVHGGLLRVLLFLPPGAGKGRDPVIRPGIAQLHQVTV